MVAAASKGIGRAVALALAREGCRLSIAARGAEALESARRELVDAGAEALAFPADLTSSDGISAWHRATVEGLGEADILVTNCGGPPAARFLDLSESQWQAGVEGTLMNVVRLCRLVLPGMRARRWGRIVHLTSFVAKQPMELLTISSTLRAGLSALTRTMSNEFARDGILVNAVLPGYVMTDRQREVNTMRAREEGLPFEEYVQRAVRAIAIGRYARPEELGEAVAFLCSERASYVSGATLQVDGGLITSTF